MVSASDALRRAGGARLRRAGAAGRPGRASGRVPRRTRIGRVTPRTTRIVPERDVHELSDLLFVPGRARAAADRLPRPRGRAGGAARAAGADARRRGGAPPCMSASASHSRLRSSREPVAPAPPVPRILALQRSAGNQAVTAMLAASGTARRAARGRHAGRRRGRGAREPGPAADRLQADAAQRRDEDPQHGADDGRAGHAARRPSRAGDADDHPLGLGRSEPQARHRPGHHRLLLLRHQAGQRARVGPRDTLGTIEGGDTIVIRGKRPGHQRRAQPRRHHRHARPRDEPHHRLRLRRAPGHRHRARPASTATRTSSAPTTSSPVPVPGIEGDARADAIRDHLVRQDQGRRHLRGPRRVVLGRAARHQRVPHQGARAQAPGRLQPEQQPVPRPARAPAARRRRRARRRSRRRCSRSASSPPPSAPRRPARR